MQKDIFYKKCGRYFIAKSNNKIAVKKKKYQRTTISFKQYFLDKLCGLPENFLIKKFVLNRSLLLNILQAAAKKKLMGQRIQKIANTVRCEKRKNTPQI